MGLKWALADRLPIDDVRAVDAGQSWAHTVGVVNAGPRWSLGRFGGDLLSHR